MTCAACEKRQAEELKQLSDCEGRCKEISAKNQRLTLALTVVSTLAGKESLDFALGLSTTVGSIAAATSVGVPDSVVDLEVVDQDRSLDSTAEASDVEGEELERAFPTDFVSRHQDVNYFPDAVSGYLAYPPMLFSDPYQGLFQSVEQDNLFVDVPFLTGDNSGQEMLLMNSSWGGNEYTPLPEAGVFPLLAFLCFIPRRRRSDG